VDKNGKLSDIPLLSNYGQDFSRVSTDGAALTIHLLLVAPGGSGATAYSRITLHTSPVIARGVCWTATGADPVIADKHTVDGSGVSDFTSIISESTAGTYKVRAWAINSSGLHYSSEVLSVSISGGGTK